MKKNKKQTHTYCEVGKGGGETIYEEREFVGRLLPWTRAVRLRLVAKIDGMLKDYIFSFLVSSGADASPDYLQKRK